MTLPLLLIVAITLFAAKQFESSGVVAEQLVLEEDLIVASHFPSMGLYRLELTDKNGNIKQVLGYTTEQVRKITKGCDFVWYTTQEFATTDNPYPLQDLWIYNLKTFSASLVSADLGHQLEYLINNECKKIAYVTEFETGVIDFASKQKYSIAQLENDEIGSDMRSISVPVWLNGTEFMISVGDDIFGVKKYKINVESKSLVSTEESSFLPL